ncbi:hypothetical protein Tco_0386337 [Tanacetum coccineum]
MYLTSSRPDIMFAVCTCARFQVNPKSLHLHDVKRIFRYLKGQPKLGLWYPKDSPFDLVAYIDSDYAGASLDRKSTTGGCQFLRCRLISWQCKKQTVTKIHIDNESTICIVKNPIFHSKTKHIEIRHNFIRDSNEKKLIQMIKIHTDHNVADLLTKAFDNGIGVNAGDSKLMLLGITYYCWLHNLQLLVNVNAVKVDKKKVIITESTIRRDLQLEDAKGTECLPTATIFEELTRMGAKTTAWNEFSSTMASAIICLATNQKFNFSKYIFDSMVKNVDSMVKFWMYPRTIIPLFQTMMVQAHEEMGKGSANPTDPHHTPTITQPSTSQPQKKQPRRKQRKDTKVSQPSSPTEPMADETENVESKVLDLETTKTIQALEIDSLKRKVKKLEKKQRSRTYMLRRLYKVGLSAKVISSYDEASLGDQEDASKQGRKILNIDVDEDITLDSTHVDTDLDIFGVHVFLGCRDTIRKTVDDLTWTQNFNILSKDCKITKVRGVRIQEPSETITTTITPATSKPSQDKDKAKITESEKPLKKKDQMMYDQEVALNLQAQLQAELEEEERLARQKEEEANIALIESWDNTQAMMDTDRLLAERLQAREQEELTDEEKARLFIELLEKRKKHFAALRAQEKRNKPPTKAQKKKIQKLFDKAMTRVNMFVDMDIELVRESLKKDEAEMTQESSSKRAVISDEEGVAIDAIPLSTKPPSIVDNKIIKEGKISIYQIIRADGSSKSMRMEQYLTHTDYTLWEVIANGDAPAVASASVKGPIPPKTAEQKLARKNELKAKSTLLLAIPDEHLLKFH